MIKTEQAQHNKTADWNSYIREWRKQKSGKLSYHETQARYHKKKADEIKKELGLIK